MNALRNELSGTDIRVLVLRPGCVATHFHEQRVGYNRGLYEEIFGGYEYVITLFHGRAERGMLMVCVGRLLRRCCSGCGLYASAAA